ncbi:E3 ubiquitin-protein ligase TRIM71-like [Pocillopora damicornis]|uniref:E3 ubiquitin-protein ligase TRIM71-like n=1 Tax=Pocillopora damicornis TaxID=46731 RepID=UPI000F5529F2|nr:E3 ubiquitin-protein ligase TRIM71-like [Pocillopora damicornis]
MDVQQLFRSLKKEAECPLCLETVKDPKTLPCLHSFCMRCIDKHAGYAKRKLETTIKCPVCQACFQIPDGDTFGNLPTSFHLNRLVDLLALRDGSEETQRCNSCEENNTATCYCFVCQNFLCKDCFDAHQRLKATRGHRSVLIDNLQAQDVEDLMHRPTMCAKKYHENEPLDYYCQDCSVCICHKCSILSHNRHSLVDLQEAAEEQKMQMTQVFARVKEKLVIVESKISEQTELMNKSEEEICAAEEKVTKFVQEIIRVAKEHETAVNGQPLTGSPWRVQATDHQYKAIHSFGSHGTETGQFKGSVSIAVNERTGKIAIADYFNRRVQLFDREFFARVKEQLVIVESKISEQTELMKKREEEICAAEEKVTKTVQEIIRVAKEHETAVKTKLAEMKVSQQRNFAAEIGNVRLIAAQLRSSVENGEDVIQRSIGPEILQAGHAVLGRCEELLTLQDVEVCIPQHVVYCVNVEAMNTVRGLVLGQVFETNTDPSQSSAEGRGLIEALANNETNFTVTTRDSKGTQWYNEQDELTVIVRSQKEEEEETKIDDCKNGSYVVRYKPKSVGLRDISVEVNGQPLTGSPWRVQATGHQYIAIHSFGSHGTEPGQFKGPGSIAVNKRTGKIAIADYFNRRVQLFDRECKYLRTIGDKGRDAEKIKFPLSVEFTTSDEVIVIHGELFISSKMFLFTEHGDLIKVIVINVGIKSPWSVTAFEHNKLLVYDYKKHLIHVLQ